MPDNDYRLQLAADLSQMERGLARITNQLAGVVGGLNETDAAIKKSEGSSQKAAESQTKFATSLNSTRYALYDVSRTMLVAGAALVAFGAAPTKVAIDFQREFSSVQRTVSGAGQDIKDQLKDLSTQIPVTFKDLTQIATLGGQLGIGKDGIVQFTETVAKLTATTNLSADVAGTALGRFQSFGLVTSAQFENLASAILKVGVNSVATETQIVTIATRIAGIGKLAGLNAATLVGFAGALASVGVQSYAASGSTIRLVQKMQDAAANGGEKLQTFAKVAGVSTDAFKNAFGTEKFNPIFRSFVENLGNVQKAGGNVNDVLEKLGLRGAIDSRTFSQLAAAAGTVKGSFDDATSGMKSAAELNKQYGITAETTAAKITELGNSILNLLDAIGSQTNGPIAGLVSGLKDITNGIADFVSTPVGQVLAIITTAFSILTGVLLLGGAVATRAAASVIGLTTAITGMNAGTGAGVGLWTALNAQLAAAGPIGARAAVAMNALGVALRGLSFAGIAGGVIIGASVISGELEKVLDGAKGWSNDLGSLIKRTTDKTTGLIDGIGRNAKGISFLQANTELDDFARGIERLMDNANFGNEFGRQVKLLDDSLVSLAKSSGGAEKLQAALNDIQKMSGIKGNDLLKNFPALRDAAADAGITIKATADNIKVSSAEMEKAAQATTDYANATGVAVGFIEQLSNATGLDAKGIDKWVQGYQKSVSPLTDFNNVVKQVQDGLEAAAEAQAKSVGGDSKASDFYDGQTVSLQAFTDQLNANNSAQQTWASNLVQISQTYGPQAAQPFIDAGYSAVNSSILQQLVNASPEQAQAYIAAQQKAAELASAATAQAILSSGYLVEGSLGGVSTQAATAFRAGLAAGIPVEVLMNNLNLRFQSTPVTPVANTEPAKSQIMSLTQIPYPDVVIGVRVNLLTDVQRAVNNAQNQANQYAKGNAYASGGHVRGAGTGTSDSIPARLSNGEYVIKASRVRQLGVGYLDSLNGGRTHTPGRFADGGPVSGSPSVGVVELGPTSLGVLRQAVRQEVGVYLGNDAIARSANNGNARMSARGAN